MSPVGAAANLRRPTDGGIFTPVEVFEAIGIIAVRTVEGVVVHLDQVFDGAQVDTQMPWEDVAMGLAAKKLDGRYSYREYCTWPTDEWWELIDGVAKNMVPAPSDSHQGVLFNLCTQIGAYLKGKPCKARFASFDVRLPAADEADDDVATVVQSDLVVIWSRARAR